MGGHRWDGCTRRRARAGVERRLRAWWRHEQFAIGCAVASATHHAPTGLAASTPQDVKGPEIEFTAPALAGTRRRRLAKRATLAAVAAYAAPVPASEHVASSPSIASATPAPATEYYRAPTPVSEYVAPAPAAAHAAPTPGIEHVTPAPAVGYTVPAPVTESASTSPAVAFAAPAPRIEYGSPAPTVTLPLRRTSW